MLRAIFSGFIGDSSPTVTVEGARRPLQIAYAQQRNGRRVHAEAVKRRQACYKRVVAGTPRTYSSA
jgi:hypothetical protein